MQIHCNGLYPLCAKFRRSTNCQRHPHRTCKLDLLLGSSPHDLEKKSKNESRITCQLIFSTFRFETGMIRLVQLQRKSFPVSHSVTEFLEASESILPAAIE